MCEDVCDIKRGGILFLPYFSLISTPPGFCVDFLRIMVLINYLLLHHIERVALQHDRRLAKIPGTTHRLVLAHFFFVPLEVVRVSALVTMCNARMSLHVCAFTRNPERQ